MVHNDLRVEWIRRGVSAGFNLSGGPNCFDELLSRRDGEEEEKILRFLNFVSEDDSPSCLLFFKTFREEQIEVEIPEVKNEEASRPQSGTDMTTYTQKKMEQSPSYSTEFQVVYHMELHVAVNEYPEKYLNSCVFYFLRSTRDTISEPLDINEAYVLMPRLFDFGIHSGDPLSVLQNKLANVYIPLLTAHQMKETGGGYQSEAEGPTSGKNERKSSAKSREKAGGGKRGRNRTDKVGDI
ncbi:dynein axonemal heavy chain 10-like [Betta splendens]|uniref:Dynein axonemal heavy chain 10-like n=1 Tax=Betta splendens TaxID=158456 RepID=A0A9W2Y196_BETSP|nr:dynein axonemal heavy chain 10-like [Betta splendens]